MNIPLNIDWQQILLHLFNFAILAGGLYLLLYRPVKDFMKKREEHYQSMDEAAERARADAAQLQEQYASRLSQADAEIAQKRVEAQRELDQLLPAHLAWAWEESITWVAWDAYSHSFEEWDGLGLTWAQLDQAVREDLEDYFEEET